MTEIIPFDDCFLDDMARLFSLVYSDDEGVYSIELAKRRLEADLVAGRDYSFVAIDQQGNCLGGIFCKLVWGDRGQELFVDTVQVDPGSRKMGLGKRLMAAAVNKAKQARLTGVQFAIDASKPFPAEWYEAMGFKKTKWVVYSARVIDIKL